MLEKVKVAIVNLRDISNYVDDYVTIVESITEWEEVTMEEYSYIRKGLENVTSSKHKFQVVMNPVWKDQHDIVIRSIAEGRKLIEKAQAEADARKAEREKIKQEKLQRQQARQKSDNEAKQREQYEKLKAKFEGRTENA